MIQRHANYTRSQRAFKVLALWEEMTPKFVKVMPQGLQTMLAVHPPRYPSRLERRRSHHGGVRGKRQRRGARRRQD